MSEGSPDRRSAADHAQVASQSRGPADRSVRPDSCRCRRGPVPVLQGPGHRRSTAPTGLERRSRKALSISSGSGACRPASKNAYESIKAFSETDFTEDLKKFDVPTLVLHGEDDQIVPVKDSARKSAKLIKGAKEIYYPGAPHGMTATHQEQVNADLLAFIRA